MFGNEAQIDILRGPPHAQGNKDKDCHNGSSSKHGEFSDQFAGRPPLRTFGQQVRHDIHVHAEGLCRDIFVFHPVEAVETIDLLDQRFLELFKEFRYLGAPARQIDLGHGLIGVMLIIDAERPVYFAGQAFKRNFEDLRQLFIEAPFLLDLFRFIEREPGPAHQGIRKTLGRREDLTGEHKPAAARNIEPRAFSPYVNDGNRTFAYFTQCVNIRKRDIGNDDKLLKTGTFKSGTDTVDVSFLCPDKKEFILHDVFFLDPSEHQMLIDHIVERYGQDLCGCPVKGILLFFLRQDRDRKSLLEYIRG